MILVFFTVLFCIHLFVFTDFDVVERVKWHVKRYYVEQSFSFLLTLGWGPPTISLYISCSRFPVP
jgi:hypothetical protein